MKIGRMIFKKLTRLLQMVMILSCLLLLTNCGWKQTVVIPESRVLECPDDKTKPCQVSRAWLLERYETERGLLKQLEECRER